MNIKKSAAFLLLILLPISFIIYSSAISQQIRDGIGACLNVIIPSLFCFMALSTFLIKTGFSNILLFPFEKIIKILFGVDKFGASVVLLSLLGGYPVGASLIVNGLDDGKLTHKQADRLLCFCVNAGPAFLIGVVGLPLLGDIKLGLIIYLSHIMACLAIANLTRSKAQKTPSPVKPERRMRTGDAVIYSAKTASTALFTVCTLIVLFSAIYAILEASGAVDLIISALNSFVSGEAARALINGTLEICKGCTSLSAMKGTGKILMASGLTAFGGVCVHMQIAAITNPHKLNIRRYIVCKLIYTAFSVLFTFVLLKIFGICIPVTSVAASSLGSSVYNHVSSVFLVGLCVLLLFNFEKSDIINYKKKR